MAQTYTVKAGDTLSKIAQQYGFKDYKSAGITGYKSGNANLIRPGEVLTIGNYKAPATTATGGNPATAMINQNQDADIADAPDPDAPPSKDEAPSRNKRYSTAFSEISELFGGKDTKRPTAPSFENTYNKLRKDLNVDDLEGYVNELQAEEEEIFATLRNRRTDERGKPVAMNVIEGRIGEAERQEAERIDYVRRQKQTAVQQLQSANATIENLINFKKLDYDTARNEYNDKLQQQVNFFNIAKGIVDSEMTDEERVATTSRANLNIIYGAITEGTIDGASISPDMKYKINQMELSAGLPTGFYEKLQNQNPNGKILSTSTRTTNGAKYADVLYQNKDGSITSKAVYMGADSTGSGKGKSDGEESEIKSFRSDASKYIEQLESRKIGWGAAFNALKAKYPEASNELIDRTLNKEAYYTTEVARDPVTGAAI